MRKFTSSMAFAAALAIAASAVAQTPRTPNRATPASGVGISRISIAKAGNDATVNIVATGRLPVPHVGVVDGPPRIFLDFANVTPQRTRIDASADPRIRRVRIALHSVTPLVTRVVLDLASMQPYRVENTSGVISVVIEGTPAPVASGIPPVPALPERATPPPAPTSPPPAPPATTASSPPVTTAPLPAVAPPVSAPPDTVPPAAASSAPTGIVTEVPVPVEPPPAPAPVRASSPESTPRTPRATGGTPVKAASAKDLEKYRKQVAGPVDRLVLQQPMLASLDANEPQTIDRMTLAVAEFDRLRGELMAVKPPDALRSHHDMLIQAATLGVMASRLRLEALRSSDTSGVRNAASAAAGAILLLDRACADIGCGDPPGR